MVILDILVLFIVLWIVFSILLFVVIWKYSQKIVRSSGLVKTKEMTGIFNSFGAQKSGHKAEFHYI